jgi:hypothetical protein
MKLTTEISCCHGCCLACEQEICEKLPGRRLFFQGSSSWLFSKKSYAAISVTRRVNTTNCWSFHQLKHNIFDYMVGGSTEMLAWPEKQEGHTDRKPLAEYFIHLLIHTNFLEQR